MFMSKTYILGISALYHNSAAALICDGEILYAAEEERFTRIKGDAAFPINAIAFCLDSAGIGTEQLSSVVFYENPAEKFGRILTSALINAPRSIEQFYFAVPEWISDKLWIEKKIRKSLGYKKGRLSFLSHHLSHAASAFYPSPFENAAILTVDGVGEWDTAAWGVGEGNRITLKECMRFPDSLGLLYSAFTFYTGFKINNGEYKMMGLAPYGVPSYADTIKSRLVKIGDDGSITLNQEYFAYSYGIRTITKRFEQLFGRPARRPQEEILQFHADIAASIQAVTDEILLKTAKHVKEQSGQNNLVMAGGVALNVTATGLLRSSGIFDNIWIQPAAGDAGAAVGAALEEYYRLTDAPRTVLPEDAMRNSFLGYSIAQKSEADDRALREKGAVWENVSPKQLPKVIAKLVSAGKIVGVAREEAEFGPRALGHRSILADARDPEMLQRLNMKIKFREGFRPFAPAVLEEDAPSFFEIQGNSAYMTFTFPVKQDRRLPSDKAESITKTASLPRSDIPAVTHVDYSARIQTVNEKTNPFFYQILSAFKELTGYGLMINTSYNTNQMPIVNNASDAYGCFMRCGMDYAVIGNRLFDKNKQPKDPKGGAPENAKK